MGVAPFKGAFRAFEATLDEQGVRGVAQASSIDVDNERPGRAPRVAGLLRDGQLPRALVRDRRDPARGRPRDARGRPRDQGQPRAGHAHRDDHRTPSSDPWGGTQARPVPLRQRRQERRRADVERPAARGRLDARRRGRAGRHARVRPGGRGRVSMLVLGIAGSLRAGSLNPQLLRLRCGGAARGRRARRLRRPRGDPAYDPDLEDLSPDAVERPQGGDRGGRRGARRDARVQRLDPGRSSRTRSTGSRGRIAERRRSGASRWP